MTFTIIAVKLKNFTFIVTAVLIVIAVMCGCRAVSEDVYIPEVASETTTMTSESRIMTIPGNQPDAEIPANVSSKTSLQQEAILSEETTAETLIESKTSAEIQTETTVTEYVSETVSTESETTVTIQTESPAETIETAAITVIKVPVAVTETTTEETFAETSYITEIETAAEKISPSVYGVNYYSALNFSEQKGIWISYLEYDSIMKNKSASSFRKSAAEYFDNVKSIGFNTVYVQVRAHGDAYYDSELYPSGDRFNGTMGTSESYDALEIMIEEAHSRGLSVHAWINPMRLMTESQISGLPESCKIKQWYDDPDKNGTYIVKNGSRWYFNPAYSEVVQFISDGITEIVANYDVDGIQIDDYFYPTTDKSFDSKAYSSSGTSLSLSDWRTKNVSSMVKKMYNAVHNANSSVVFGISPQGSVDNNYEQLYADVRTWCSQNGYCDYMLPQIYFGFENATLPYEDTVSLWSSMIGGSNVKLVIGLAGYKSGVEDTYAGASGKNEWIENSDVLARQMSFAAEMANYGGIAIFRYDSLFAPASSVAEQVSVEIKNIKKVS